jgi:antitoxin HicB
MKDEKKVAYIAVVEHTNDGWYAISFPDLSGAHAQARSLADVTKEAESALCEYLAALRDMEKAAPEPSDIESITLAPGQFSTIAVGDVDAYLRRADTRTIKKTVSLPAWMAKGAERADLSLSKVLQDALRDQLAG